MTSLPDITQDRAEIEALIATQFRSLSWDEKTPPNLTNLAAGFLPDAQLFASARPARAQSAADFATRMDALRNDGTLRIFEERGRGLHVWVAGNIAVAMAGCEMHENRQGVTEDIGAYLLVKDPDGWRIAAQAWDILPAIAGAFAATGLTAEPFDV